MLLMARADARALPFREACVQCVVTSPPYFGLRDYGTARWEGGDPACDHTSTRREGGPADTYIVSKQSTSAGSSRDPIRSDCRLCGAHRLDQQIGLEPTIDAYVSTLVAVFREVRRVLKSDGVCWLNLGDSYAANGVSGLGTTDGHGLFRGGEKTDSRIRERSVPAGLKPKDLCMIPARVALALQADGWWLRSEIVWSKPNPMPESVTDRPTKAHEMIYLLAKQERYYFDADAVREAGDPDSYRDSKRAIRPWHEHGQGLPGKYHNKLCRGVSRGVGLNGRNLRSVWHLATQPYAGAHFATMPEKLVERCILAGSRAGDLILDPFLGSGTVARVALRLGRRAIGSDINPAYLELADDRTQITYRLPFVFSEEQA